MRKYILCFALIAGLLLCAQASWATTPDHEAMYRWYYNDETGKYGTDVNQIEPEFETWAIGDTSGETVIEVYEKFWEVYDGDEFLYSEFEWWVVNDDLDNLLIPETGIASLHIFGYGIVPIEYEVPWEGTYKEWSFDIVDKYYVWTAPESGAGRILEDDTLTGFGVTVYSKGYEISNGGADWESDGSIIEDFGDGYWRVSHPAPEPSSMLLLGIGLFGFAGRAVRKRFKA